MSNGSGMFSDQSALKPHLVQPGPGVAGEVADLRGDVGRTVAGLCALTVDEYTNAPVDDANALMLQFAPPEVATTYRASAGDFDGVLADGIIDVASAGPRRLRFTTAGVTPGDAPATCTVVGKDGAGRALTETVTLAQTATTADSVNYFAEVDELRFAAADGPDSLMEVGFAGPLGLRQKIVSRAGVLHAIEEIDPVAVGSPLVGGAITATFVDAATDPPFGSVAPTTAVDGSRDYAYVYEYDPTETA